MQDTRKTATYSVYIDESGDLGFNRGTHWFVISAVVVKKENEGRIRSKMAAIKTRLNIREIHFSDIPVFMKKAYIVRELNQEEFTYMSVIVDTKKFDYETTLDNPKIPDPIIAYNVACKYLLQRVSCYLKDLGETADVVLSARGTSRDKELIDYIVEKLLPHSDRFFHGETFNQVEAKTAASWDLLQLADVCATTMFLKYEENKYGFCTPCFAVTLEPHLYNRRHKIDTYGIKFFREEMRPDETELKSKMICAKKERTPGATTT